MALVTLRDVHKTFGETHLLRGVSLVINEGERIGLVGANGSGKTTLLRIVAGRVGADEGERTVRRDLRLGYLEQEPQLGPDLPVREAIARGLGEREEVLAALQGVHDAFVREGVTDALLRRQAELENRLALLGGHEIGHRVEAVARGLGLHDLDAACGTLSGGEQRRTALARLLLAEPDLLVLDEPTNHLDALVTEWLEDHLLESRLPMLLVTHDRYLLDRAVDRMLELENGTLFSYDGSYGDFLANRADRLEAERRAERTRLNLLRRETEWMRRGPPARSTKAKARIRRYEALTEAAPETGPGDLAFAIPPGPRLGTKVIRLHGVRKAFGPGIVLDGLDLEIGRGERIGVAGPNGAGKTTLLRLCMGLLAPDAGRVDVGPTVRFSYLDQTRADLDEEASLLRAVSGGEAWVTVGERTMRVEGYLESFLFPRATFERPVGKLSGGERNRVLLARLLLQGGNVVVLDEPTNDLDLATLRVLEEALLAFDGTVLVVSHDRSFLDRVATRIVYLDGSGGVRLHPGDMSDLIERMRAASAAPRRPRQAPRRTEAPRRPHYRERRELEGLPDVIADREAELARLDAELADPALYAGPEGRVRDLAARRKALAAEIGALYARWEELEGLASGD